MRAKCIIMVIGMMVLGISIVYAEQPVCGSWTPAMVGGPAAHGKDLLSVRWIEGPNLELTYNNKVYLFSAYFDRGPDFQMLTVNPKNVKRADAIFLGHGHFDHMSDAIKIAQQTGAKIYAQKVTIDLIKKVGELPIDQLVTIKDGLTLDFGDFKMEAVRMHHSGKDQYQEGERIYDQVPPAVDTAFRALKAAMYTKSAAQKAWEASSPYNFPPVNPPPPEPEIGYLMQKDVLGLLLTFGKDFTFFYHDSTNFAVTEEVKQLMKRIKKTDIASIAYAGSPAQYAVPWGMPETITMNPHYVIPNHHWPSHDMDVNPYAVAVRNAIPGASLLSLMPNQVICFNVKNHKLMSDGVIVP